MCRAFPELMSAIATTSILSIALFVLAAPKLPAIQLEDGRTAWLLAGDQEIAIPAHFPRELEIRFHRGPAGRCEGPRKLLVFEGGLPVLELADAPPEGFDDARITGEYRDFDVWFSPAIQVHLPPDPRGSVSLRLLGAPCGASIARAPLDG